MAIAERGAVKRDAQLRPGARERLSYLGRQVLQGLGLHLQRWHDPFVDAATHLGGTTVGDVVDGGAYHGAATRRMLSAFSGATVHAFEPQQREQDFLQREFATEPRVKLHQLALSDAVGVATLHVNAQAYTTSLLTPLAPALMTTIRTQEVATTTLDAWSDASGVQPAFLKLDLQGKEQAALLGASRLLRESVRAVLAEVNMYARYHGGCLFHEITGTLYDYGFRLHRLYEVHGGKNGGWAHGDALYLHSDLP